MSAKSVLHLYNGKDIHAVGDEYRAKIGYLPQDVSFYGDFTGRDYLEYSAALKGMKSAHKKADRGIGTQRWFVG